MKKIFASLFIAVLLLASCKKDDTICYNNMTMANIVDEVLVSDQGNTFDIVEPADGINFDSFEYDRVILVCDVLKKTSEKRYDIRLDYIAQVVDKDALYASTITPESEASVDDPVILRDIWYGGGYINMIVEFVRIKDSHQKHLINLIYDDTAATEDGEKTYSFTLRHNAFGENPADESVLDFELAGGYVSFPVAGNIIKENEAKITLNWKTLPVENGNISWLESKEMSRTYDWKRSGFEQPRTKKIGTMPRAMIK